MVAVGTAAFTAACEGPAGGCGVKARTKAGRRGIFSGIHLLSPALHRLLPPDRFASVVAEGYRPLMAEGRVFGHYADAPWWDLGTPARYEEAVKEFLTGSLPRS